MALLVECPECKKRNSQKAKTCTCGFALAKFTGRVYWIDYLMEGQRKRERIGPNRGAAEQRYREVKSALIEGRYIQKSPDAQTHLKDLAAWYLGLPEVKAKRSYDRDKRSLKLLKGFTFHDLRHTAINNWRLQGHDYFRIMAATGHKTMTVFKRYNTVSKDELKTLVQGKI